MSDKVQKGQIKNQFIYNNVFKEKATSALAGFHARPLSWLNNQPVADLLLLCRALKLIYWQRVRSSMA